MKYDDASWHYGGDFPHDSPVEYGATHIALFMKWCFIKRWASEFHTNRASGDINKLLEDSMSAVEYLLEYCDGKLTDQDFTDEGNAFAKRYYGDKGLYLRDYGEHFAALMYIAPEKDHNFKKFSSVLESRYKSGILTEDDL